ncbi:hypothetical protein ACVMIX_007143 [Rhizobium leguminosarum]
MAIQDLAIIKEHVRSPNIIIALCGLLILFDGYDLIVYGAVAPALLGERPAWWDELPPSPCSACCWALSSPEHSLTG